MEVKSNVVAAISTALHLYIESEQQQAASVLPLQRAPEPPRQVYSAWALSGRQAAMEMRRLWQMRLAR